MTSRRVLRRLGVLSLVAGLAVAGCGGDDDAGAPAGGGDTAAKELSGTITVWHYYDEGAGDLFKLLPVWEKRFEQAHPKVDVKYVYTPYDQQTSKVVAASAAGKGPDLVLLTHPFLPEMVKAGAVAELDQYWDAFGDKDQFPAETVDIGRIEDKLYMVQAYANVTGLYYNKDILGKLGAEPPASLEELGSTMAEAKSAGFKGLGLHGVAGAGGEYSAFQWLGGNGWSYEDAGNSGGADFWRMLGDWVDKGYIDRNDSTGFNATKDFLSGKYAFAQDGNWNLTTIGKDAKFDWGVAPVPGSSPTAALGGETFAIGRFSENPDAAWRFVEEIFLSKRAATEAAGAGSIPLRKDVVGEAAVADDPNLKTFADIAASAGDYPVMNENAGRIAEVVGGAWNELIAGKLDGEEAQARIAEEVPPLVSE